jgi:DNA (cytosine-5)-methyltransferase 1
MRFGSVCSGIEAATVAWAPLGWEPAWLSEIEKFPSALLAEKYPTVKNHGDMRLLEDLIRTEAIEAPELFCGGTPCQSFSVAGKRDSLDDERGNLTLTFCEIADAIDDVRINAGRKPTIVFWENVHGVFSAKGNAFGCFLGKLAGEDRALEAPRGKWKNAGCVFGPKRAIAWRTLNAEFFGVPQRRRRVYVIASAMDGLDPAKILFEQANGSGNIEPRSKTRKDVIGTVTTRTDGSGRARLDFALSGGLQPYLHTETCSTLKARDHKGPSSDGDGDGDGDGAVLVPMVYCIPATHIGCSPEHGGNSKLFWENKSPCLTSDDKHAVVSVQGAQDPNVSTELAHCCGTNRGQENIVFISENQRGEVRTSKTSPALGLGGGKAGQGYQAVLEPKANRQWPAEIAGTLDTAYATKLGLENQHINSGATLFALGKSAKLEMHVRRLLPIEFERLQGFPDEYTVTKTSSDTSRYKALGNSWAVPVVRWIGERIAQAVECIA